MTNCILCGKPTTGSVGAAGLRWHMICQPCKDEEDNALLQTINAQAFVLNAVFADTQPFQRS